ncbi:MAG: hypothetical protein Q7J45_01725 [bacterium]|nr:hypothetical protein [bacterium]
MDEPHRSGELRRSRIKFLARVGIALIVVVWGALYLKAESLGTNSENVAPEPVLSIEPGELEDPEKLPSKPVITPTIALSFDGIAMLYPTKENSRVWYSKWAKEKAKTLHSGDSDPVDREFVSRGDGAVYIQGDGTVRLEGDAPRMYVLDPAKNKKWNNVEVTIYAKRVSEYGSTSSQGIVIGARSEHQDATEENPCFGATYYGRLLYDGRAVFQKELIHEGSYSRNKPSETHKTKWNTVDASMPSNVWIGVKFIVKSNPDGGSVKLELHRDLTDGKNGGAWEKVAEYTDRGDWSQINPGIDVQKICGYPANKILLEPGTSVFIRNDEIKDAEYKLFSIREIE